RQACRLDDEVYRFGDRHKVARHVGVGDRDWPACLDLALKDWDDASPAAEHVPEADRRKERLTGALGESVHHHLAHTLAGAHYAGRIDRLIGRDQDEAFSAVLAGELGHQPRPADV